VRLLSRNPDFTKATLAGGLLASGTVMSPVMPLVMVGLRTRVWGERMTEFTAIVNSSNGVMAMLASGLVGRMSDRMDRRVAAAIIGVMGFLPTWVLLLCGLNWVGLWGFSLATALGGVACITASGCPTMYALVNDTMPPGDREMVYGIAFSALIVIAGVCTAGGFAISQAMGDSPEAVLLYMATLHVVYFLVLASIGKAHRVTADDGAGGEVAITSPQGSARLGEEGEGEVDGGSSDEGSSGSSSGGEGSPGRSKAPGLGRRCQEVARNVVAPLDLVCGSAALRGLCAVAGLVSLPEVALTDITSQYTLSNLDLIFTEDSRAQRHAQELVQWPGMGLLIPAFYLAGVAGKRIGPLRVLQLLLPAIALGLLLPAVLRLYPRMWIVPIIGVGIPLSFVCFAPLQALVSLVAPDGRVGEAMGAVGASKQIAGLCANLGVYFASPALLRSGLEKPFWVFYPVAAACALLAWLCALALRLPPGREA